MHAVEMLWYSALTSLNNDLVNDPRTIQQGGQHCFWRGTYTKVFVLVSTEGNGGRPDVLPENEDYGQDIEPENF